ncbi:helicase-associated domain-containing protein [Frankia sp. Cr2]|uniref:helicase-associated domain-containing protein n=1 Tax=Frankia sp. Cr2 TaxID=3073932 RepID=UPI002AD30ADF|nr:helicase-associated domain-containing protein [Frankia sp. Cr2]
MPFLPEPTALARYLATLAVGELTEVLRAVRLGGRPALTLGELADRLESAERVLGCLQTLRRDHHEVIEAVLALGVAARPATLAGLLDAREGSCEGAAEDQLAGILADLRRAALVWPAQDGRFAVADPLWQVFSAPLGTASSVGRAVDGYITSDELARVASRLGLRPGSRKDARIAALREFFGDLDRIRALVATAPAATRALLEQLAHGDPTVAFEDDQYTMVDGKLNRSESAQTWARERLILTGAYRSVHHLVAEVSVALRGVAYRAPFTVEPPRGETVPIAAETVARGAGAALVQTVEQCDAALRVLATRPLVELKKGGIGVKEQRRFVAEAGTPDERVARLYVEIAQAGELAGYRDGAFRITDRYRDEWMAAEPWERAALLVRSWLGLVAMPLARSTEAAGEYLLPPTTAVALTMRDRRRAVLEAFGALPAGQAVAEPGPILARARWLRAQPGVGVAVDRDRAEAVVTEAEILGVIVAGALSPIGRALLHRDPSVLSEALRVAMPEARTTAFFQTDLTAVVAGAAGASLMGLLDSAADREAASASVWRFSASSVRRALDAGVTAEDLLSALADVSEKPLPQPLEYLVSDVGRRHGEAAVVAASCCVVVGEPALLTELLAVRDMAALGLRRVAPTVAVCGASPGKTLGALRLAGYFPTGNIDGQTLTVAPAEPTSATSATSRTKRRKPVGKPPVAGARPAQATAGPADLVKPHEGLARSRVHVSVNNVEDVAAALVGTALEAPMPYLSGSRWYEVSEAVAHLTVEEGYVLAGALATGASLTLVIDHDPGHPQGHVVEQLTLAGVRLTGWCVSHDVSFSGALDDISAVPN